MSQKQSQTIYPVAVDFDDAHDAWMANKRKLPNGMFRYICCATTKDGKPCGRTPELHSQTCIRHRAKPEPIAKPKSILSRFSNSVHRLHKPLILTNTRFEPILDVVDETILIHTTPPFRGSFSQLIGMMNKYESVAEITDEIQANRLPEEDIGHLLLCLQLILSFLDGMDELSKLETKRSNIVKLQARVLEFHGYDSVKHIHTTSAKWQDMSRLIRDKTITLLMYLYDRLEFEVGHFTLQVNA